MNASALLTILNANKGMEVDAFAAIESLSPGEYVRMVDSKGKIGIAVYVVDGYCCINRGYMVTRYDDASRDKKLAKGTIVHVGFDF